LYSNQLSFTAFQRISWTIDERRALVDWCNNHRSSDQTNMELAYQASNDLADVLQGRGITVIYQNIGYILRWAADTTAEWVENGGTAGKKHRQQGPQQDRQLIPTQNPQPNTQKTSIKPVSPRVAV